MRNLNHPIIAGVISLLACALVSCGNQGGKLASITITPAEAMLVAGSTLQLKATAIFSDGTRVNWTAAAEWATTDSGKISVSNEFGSYGLATALATTPTGSVTITATDVPNNISGTAVLSVVDPVSLSIILENPCMLINTSQNLKAAASLPDGTTQELTSYLTWTTDASAVAEVVDNSTGRIESRGTGITDIIVTYTYPDSRVTGTAQLTVADNCN